MLVHLFACLKMSSLPPKRLKRESHFSAASKALDLVTLSLWALVSHGTEWSSRRSAEGIRGRCRQILCFT